MKAYIMNGFLAALSLLVLFSACNREDNWDGKSQTDNYFFIEGTIIGADVAARSVTNELGSHTKFEYDDRIGFYSFHENGCDRGTKKEHQDNGDDKEYLKNECLTYSKASGTNRFESKKLTDINLNSVGVTFAYFPYSSTPCPEDYVKYDAKDQGYVSLTEADHYIHIFDDQHRVVDLLTATKRQYFNVNYQFGHQFSMLLIFLGDGFSPDNNDKLTVHLTEKIIGAHITRTWDEHSEGESFPFTVDRVPLDRESVTGYSSFITGKVENYTLPGKEEARTVYPVILPYGTKIDYIEVMDEKGKTQKVNASELAQLESNYMYPLTIRMNSGLKPTVYPHEIIPWGNPEEIKVDRLPGVYTSDDLREWMEVYNRNVGQFPEVNPGDVETMKRYGTYDEQEGWTFYIRDAIDCTGITSESGCLITKLVEGVTIDGGYHYMKNLMLDFEHKEPTGEGIGFFGEIKGGYLKNLRLEFPTVRYRGTEKPAGCIAGKISGGQITYCTVLQAAMICWQNAGVLAGALTGGEVSDCKFHGMVQAVPPQEGDNVKEEYWGIVGSRSENSFLSSSIVNQVNFIPLETGN